MGQLVMEWLKKEPTELQEYIVLCVMIFFFGILFARIGRLQLGKNPGEKMFRESLALAEHELFGAACKLAIYTVGQDCVCWLFLLGSSAQMLGRGWTVVAAVPISVLFTFMPPHTAVGKKTTLAAIACGGFILSLLYLKCGGWNGYSVRALAITSVAHLWVTGLIAVAYYQNKNK